MADTTVGPGRDPLHNCRVCGYYTDFLIWGEDGRTASFGICPCCEVEWGYEDALPEGARAYREAWLTAGATWAQPEEHDGLTTEERLEHVPPGYE